jgi:hypothetical protein
MAGTFNMNGHTTPEMARSRWNPKSKDKKGGRPARRERRERPPFAMPRGRLWEERGILEEHNILEVEDLKALIDRQLADEPLEDPRMLEDLKGILPKVNEARQDQDYHDLNRATLIYDIFTRSWGTEVLVYVWWAKWDDVAVRVIEDGFEVEVDLGKDRDVLVT